MSLINSSLDYQKLMFKPDILSGQRVLVSGGGTGLGKIMTEGCAHAGATVYICGRRGGVLEQTAEEINTRLGREAIIPMVCDLRSDESIEAVVEAIWAHGGPLTGLVNNAAGNFVNRTEVLSPGGYDAIVNTVARGSFLLTTACGKRWLAEKVEASVVSILTTWVYNGGPFCVPSAMAKAGVFNMTQSLAVEWGGRGIRLNSICPGAFPTEGMSARLLTDEQPEVSEHNPMRRNGKPEELANLLIYLMAPGSGFVNGQTIAIDGAGYQMNGANFASMTSWSDEDWQDATNKIRATNAKDKASRTV